MYDRLRRSVDQVEGYCTGGLETRLVEKYNSLSFVVN